MTVRAVVDTSKCQGYANCVLEADGIFDLDEETGKATVRVEQVPADLAEDARRAAASCPVAAIDVVD